MNINQNNIQRQQPTTANRQQPPSFQTVERKNLLFANFYHSNFYKYGLLESILIEVLRGAFHFKSLRKNTNLISFVDYTYKQLSDKLDGAFSPYQIKKALANLVNQEVIKCEGQGDKKDRRRGNRILLGNNFPCNHYKEDRSYLDTSIVAKHGAHVAMIVASVESHSTAYSQQKKQNIDSKPKYHIVMTQKLNKDMLKFMTPNQFHKARAKVIKEKLLFKIRCVNKNSVNQWIYTTDLKWFTVLSKSTFKNYKYQDDELSIDLGCGVTTYQIYNLNRHNSLEKAYEKFGQNTHIAKIEDPSGFSYTSKEYIDLNHGQPKNNGYVDISRKRKNYKNCKQNIQIDDLTLLPTMKIFYTVCDELWMTRAQADEYWVRYYYLWRDKGMPRNWVAVLIAAVRRANKLKIKPKPQQGLENCGLPQYLRAG